MKDDHKTGSTASVVDWTGDAHMFEQLFDASPVPMVITSLTRDYVLVANRRAAEVLAARKDELIGGRVTDYYAEPAERDEVLAAIRRDGRTNDIKLRLRRRDGTQIWAAASARSVGWHGEPAIVTAFIDITDQIVAEQAVAASEHRLAAQIRALTALTE